MKKTDLLNKTNAMNLATEDTKLLTLSGLDCSKLAKYFDNMKSTEFKTYMLSAMCDTRHEYFETQAGVKRAEIAVLEAKINAEYAKPESVRDYAKILKWENNISSKFDSVKKLTDKECEIKSLWNQLEINVKNPETEEIASFIGSEIDSSFLPEILVNAFVSAFMGVTKYLPERFNDMLKKARSYKIVQDRKAVDGKPSAEAKKAWKDFKEEAEACFNLYTVDEKQFIHLNANEIDILLSALSKVSYDYVITEDNRIVITTTDKMNSLGVVSKFIIAKLCGFKLTIVNVIGGPKEKKN